MIELRGEVGLRQHDLRAGTALPSDGEVSFEPSRIGWRVQALDDPETVHVRREHLRDAAVPRRRASDRRTAGEEVHDEPRIGRVATRLGEHPVADHGRPRVPAESRVARTRGRMDDPAIPVMLDDPAGPALDAVHLPELRPPLLVPAP